MINAYVMVNCIFRHRLVMIRGIIEWKLLVVTAANAPVICTMPQRQKQPAMPNPKVLKVLIGTDIRVSTVRYAMATGEIAAAIPSANPRTTALITTVTGRATVAQVKVSQNINVRQIPQILVRA